MVRFIGLMALFCMFLLAGCGERIVYRKAPADQTGSQLKITGKNTQEVQLFMNKDGSIRFIEYGTIPVFPADVDRVAFCSYRTGYDKYSQIVSQIDQHGLTSFSGVPNNENVRYMLILKNGDICNVLFDKRVVTYKPMKVVVNDSGSISYGQPAESLMTLFLDVATMKATLKWNAGCDLIFGTKQKVDFQQGLKIVAELGDGTTYSGNIIEGADGNLSAELPPFSVA
ncbi:MAG: hypothetical protein PHW24_01940, partial [Candidatus Moranbacteria bacterium]|nr:hypothetical protein [Candidatus Moranbacteria bacterium]